MPASEEALRAAACTSNDSLLRSARSCKNAGSPVGGCAKEFSTRRSSTLRGGMAQVWPARASPYGAAGASSETAAYSSGDAPAAADGAGTDSVGRSKPGAFTSMMPARDLLQPQFGLGRQRRGSPRRSGTRFRSWRHRAHRHNATVAREHRRPWSSSPFLGPS